MITVPSSSMVFDWFNLQDESTMVLQTSVTHQLKNTISHPEALKHHQCIRYDSIQEVCKRGFYLELA
jgi:hypothetical protein